MTQQAPELFMIQMWMKSRRLAELGKMLHLPLRQTSNSYLVHCALYELFQKQAPTPFCLEDHHQYMSDYTNSDRYLPVLCYSAIDKEDLNELAKGFASPSVYHILNWDRLLSKPMPVEYPNGMKLGFELRVCPVVRKASDGKKWEKGQEVDAFLSRVWEVDDENVSIEREEVYNDWLQHMLEKQSGAKLLSSQIKRFSLERMSRRTHGENRKVRIIKRPDVVLTGTLEVQNSEAFKELLKIGIGRHKSFGFGMLKIRRMKN
ncbi:MAG: type I-E CRISPR-associated protein Cas6/Cse3/CasE [Balneolales bacterium]